MRVVAEVIITLALLLSTGFGGAVYGEKMRDELHKSVNEINKKALKKAIRYSKIELRVDFGARGPKVIEKVPLYSPMGKLIYFYVIFKDREGKIFFSMVSVSYKYAPVICDGAGYGYLSVLRNAERKVINNAFEYGLLRIPMKNEIQHYIYFGQLNFGYQVSSEYLYMIGTERFLHIQDFRMDMQMAKNGENIEYLWDVVNKTLENPGYYGKGWWTTGMVYDSQVLYIQWYKGCVPTSIAMIIGYLHNYGYDGFPHIAHLVYSDGEIYISDNNAREIIEFLVDYWGLDEENEYGVQWWKIEDGVWALIRHYGYIPTHNSVYGDIETIYRGGLNRLAWNDYGAIVDGVERWNMPSFVGLMHSIEYRNHGVVAVGYKYHKDLFGWHDKRLYIHDTWYNNTPMGTPYEYHVDGDFHWWDIVAHYDVLNFYPVGG